MKIKQFAYDLLYILTFKNYFACQKIHINWEWQCSMFSYKMSRELDHDCFCLQKYFEVHPHHPLSEFCEDVQDINRTLQCFGLLSSSLPLLQLMGVII